ncbi:DNA cytosine methyltransferase [Neisseria sp. S1]|uniref:DNA cytosine methyltransferase n=1 Tax=Neisseria sp. S1 TaxID=3318354 RepID=UPI003A8AE3F3
MNKAINYGSVCSGIEAASVAWEQLGWRPAWFAEVDPFPAAVLAHHWPSVPNLGDMTKLPEKILAGEISAPDILVGGTPCQAFSVAGERNSLDDERGNLTLVLVRILNAIDIVRSRAGQPPCILVWENVPGVLSTRDNAFGCFLAALAGEEQPLEPAGKKWTNAGAVFGQSRKIAWRVLDAQFFGVPQRRRRVFLVASAGDLPVAEILFERDRVRGDFETGEEERQNPTAFVESSFGAYGESKVGGTLRASGGAIQGGSETLLVINGRQDPCVSDKAHTLDCQHNGMTNVIAIAGNIINRDPDKNSGGNGVGASDDGIMYTLKASDVHAVADTYQQVRRLTPIECERLQGFPDNHTRIPWRGKPAEDCPDGLRYKAIGNSMAVPVMRWLGVRVSRAIGG